MISMLEDGIANINKYKKRKNHNLKFYCCNSTDSIRKALFYTEQITKEESDKYSLRINI